MILFLITTSLLFFPSKDLPTHMVRDDKLMKLRPVLELDLSLTLPEEQFQNQTMQPIVKLQHELLLTIFQNYLLEKAIKFYSLSAFQQRITIENAVKRDLPLRHTLSGCIIGLFTTQEYTFYFTKRIPLQKRLIILLVQRLSDSLITHNI